jgi:hypothetical protein
LCGPDSTKALCGGLFTDHKAKLLFFFFAFLFCRATWQVSWEKRKKWLGGGCFQKIKWNAYYYFGKKYRKKERIFRKKAQ